MPDREPAQLTLPAAAWIGALLAALILVGMLATLVAVLISLEGTRSEIRTTRMGVTEAEERFERITRQLDPLIAAAAPLADGTAKRELRRTGRDVAGAARELPGLARSAQEASEAAAFVASDLLDADLAGTLRAVRALADAGLGGERLVDALNAVSDLSANLRAQLRTTERQLATTRVQLDVNQKTLAILTESLAIQRETLESVRSLDRKTGGPAPATPANLP